LPDGEPAPGATTDTFAVKVTASPKTDGSTELTMLVCVVAGSTS
jgi:hypothetical protein